ncbi:POTRA domain-containing ShlB-type protein [Pseudomonas sp. OV226]|nr:POTRA domain-containing ShlB-type protein [Pseudomonas sp. OV226]
MRLVHLGMKHFLWMTLASLSGLNATQAAAETPGDQDLLRQHQERLLEQQQRRLEALKALPGKAAQPAQPMAPADKRCFPIKDIDLQGAESLSVNERERLLKPYLGQCLGVPQLNELLKTITDHYIDKGLVTSRAYLPQQDLSTGHLKVLVV